MQVLVIGAHPDDELLGCAATMHKLARCGHTVRFERLWPGRGASGDNAMDAKPLIETVKRIEALLEEFPAERIYTHSAADLNVDHVVVHRAVVTATRPCGTPVSEIYCFEIASSTEWNFGGRQFCPNVFEAVTREDMEYKIAELHRLYSAEMRSFPHPRSPEYIQACATRWAAVIGVAPFAEAFELIRSVRA